MSDVTLETVLSGFHYCKSFAINFDALRQSSHREP